MTQVYPLELLAYGLGILLLIQDLSTAHPSVTQLWYADYSGTGVTFTDIQRQVDNLMVQGSLHDYLPYPTKSILVVSPQKVPWAEVFF